MSKIKICGITNLEDAKLAESYGADYLGFIFCQQSPRCISLNAAQQIVERLNNVCKVGVFVEQTDDEIANIMRLCDLQLAQIYRDSTLNPNQIISAASINENITDRRKTKFTLIDSFDQQLKGGTGKTFDWKKLPNDLSNCFVAGGINERNIKTLIDLYQPFAIDVCSSIEVFPGKKNPKNLINLLTKVKNL